MAKKNFINQAHVEGVLYEHNLEAKVSGENSKNPGTPFITGSISVATDDEMTNIVNIHFTYVTPTFAKSGKTNDTYTLLKNVIDGVFGTYMKDGIEKAIKVRVDSAIGLNEFFTEKNGKEELVSAKRYEGGFVHRADVLDEDPKVRNSFKADMLINSVTRVEADEEKGTPEKVIVKGAIFDFNKNLLPVEFAATNPYAMDYFDGLGVSAKEPIFTFVWGRQISEVIKREIRTESAFGEDEVREVKSTRREFLITGAAKDPYVWDDETTITATELNEAIQKREIDLAAMKKRQDEYKASKNNAPATMTVANGGFNF